MEELKGGGRGSECGAESHRGEVGGGVSAPQTSEISSVLDENFFFFLVK